MFSHPLTVTLTELSKNAPNGITLGRSRIYGTD